jgi:hypothetical protein
MKTQLSTPSRTKARYTEEYNQKAPELWRNSGRSAAKVAAELGSSAVVVLGHEIDARIGLTVQLSESHVVVRVSGLAVLNDYSETRAFFKPRVRNFGDVRTGPICSILGLCVVIIPPISRRIGSRLSLSGIKVYPAKNIPDIPTL